MKRWTYETSHLTVDGKEVQHAGERERERERERETERERARERERQREREEMAALFLWLLVAFCRGEKERRKKTWTYETSHLTVGRK